jgi:hypothetical protein
MKSIDGDVFLYQQTTRIDLEREEEEGEEGND